MTERLSADEIGALQDRVIEGIAADDRQSMADYDEALAALRRLVGVALEAERLRGLLVEAEEQFQAIAEVKAGNEWWRWIPGCARVMLTRLRKDSRDSPADRLLGPKVVTEGVLERVQDYRK